MGRKKDLIKVFGFLIELLKDERTSKKKSKKVKQEKESIEVPIPEVVNTPEETLLDKMFGDSEHIKNLMDRMEAKTKETAIIQNALEKQKKEFNEELKKVKEEALEKAFKEKIEDEISFSGTSIPTDSIAERKN